MWVRAYFNPLPLLQPQLFGKLMFQIRNWLANCLVAGTLASAALLHAAAAQAASESVVYSF
jgi:hypothetical protein